jgi:hypothetical protein
MNLSVKAFCMGLRGAMSGRLGSGHVRFRKDRLNQINKNAGRQIKYLKEDADTGEEVSSEDIIKAYKIGTDTDIEVSRTSWKIADVASKRACRSSYRQK